jgi:hypothetical protein
MFGVRIQLSGRDSRLHHLSQIAQSLGNHLTCPSHSLDFTA